MPAGLQRLNRTIVVAVGEGLGELQAYLRGPCAAPVAEVPEPIVRAGW